MMFNPMGSAMRNMSKGRAIPSSKARYSQIYERALQDKISSRLQDQQKQQQGQSETNQHTPSSASYQMTLSTLDLIEFVLREYEQTNSVMMQPVATKKQPYTIYEDLKIVYSLGREGSSINSSSYKRLAEEGYVRRSLESIKSRYSDFLKNLTKEDYQEILSFIEINGLKGFLIFEKNNEGVRMLLRIQKNDPRSEMSSAHVNATSNSGLLTPVRSPIRPLGKSSPSLFSAKSPSQPQMHPGFMPYFFPPYSMYPPPDYSSSSSSYMNAQPMSPYKQSFDPYAAMQMMMMNPFMAQQYPHMMPPQQQQQQHSRYMMHQMGDSDGGNVEFEVRPRLKNSASKAATAATATANQQDWNNEDEKLSAGAEPRKKFKVSSEENGQQSVRRNLKGKMESENNFLKPPSMYGALNSFAGASKIQTTLSFSSRNPHSKDTELRSSGGAAPRALTKEVYDLINDEDRIAKQDFESVLDYVSETIKMRKEELVDILDALSGSFPDFAVYMETKHESMLWNSEEDKILQSITSQDSSEFKLLMKLKGLKSIKKRFAYCKIEPSFNL